MEGNLDFGFRVQILATKNGANVTGLGAAGEDGAENGQHAGRSLLRSSRSGADNQVDAIPHAGAGAPPGHREGLERHIGNSAVKCDGEVVDLGLSGRLRGQRVPPEFSENHRHLTVNT